MDSGAETVIVEPSTQMLTGALAAIALIALLLVGAVSAATGSWGGQAQNWLVLLYGINAEGAGLPLEALGDFRAVDAAALGLLGVAFLGVRPVLGAAQKTWTAIAAALPVAGIAVLAVTGLAGRSAFMAAGLLLAWRMTKTDGFRLLGCAGLVANGLLLLADVATSDSLDPTTADIVAMGYAALVVWLAWLAVRLLRPLRGRLVPVGTHLVAADGGGCRSGGSDTVETFDLPLYSRAEGALGTYVGVADASTRLTVDDAVVDLGRFLEVYDEADGALTVRVEERGRLAAFAIEKRGAQGDGSSSRPV